jgi:hypothetical protein
MSLANCKSLIGKAAKKLLIKYNVRGRVKNIIMCSLKTISPHIQPRHIELILMSSAYPINFRIIPELTLHQVP